MSKRYVFCLFLSLYFFNIQAQTFGAAIEIDANAISPTDVKTGDIDGDGDIDVVASMSGIIALYRQENLAFEKPVFLATNLQQVFSLAIADLDGDGDLDITTVTFDQGRVIWFENIDGEGTFASPSIISTTPFGPVHIITADIDADGDEDILVSASMDTTLYLYRNNNNTAFVEEVIIGFPHSNGRVVFAGDIDGDGDLDLVFSSLGGNLFTWLYNEGTGTFGAPNNIPATGAGVEDLSLADIDGDGDLDVVLVTTVNSSIAWCENTNGLGAFGPQQFITTNAASRALYVTDLDNDGAIDVVAALGSTSLGKIEWYKNLDGLGTFSEGLVIEPEADATRGVHAADLDGDGDMDVIGTLRIANKITWYENQTILSTPTFKPETISIVPNPAQDKVSLQSTIPIKKIHFYNAEGKKLEIKTTKTEQIDISYLSQGVYFIEVVTENGSQFKKLIKQ